MHSECKKVPEEKKAQQTAQPQERDRGGTAGQTRGQVSMHGEGQEMFDLAAPQKPAAQTCKDFMLRHPLGSLTPRRSWALGTHHGGLSAKGGHIHITAFPKFALSCRELQGASQGRGAHKSCPTPCPTAVLGQHPRGQHPPDPVPHSREMRPCHHPLSDSEFCIN